MGLFVHLHQVNTTRGLNCWRGTSLISDSKPSRRLIYAHINVMNVRPVVINPNHRHNMQWISAHSLVTVQRWFLFNSDEKCRPPALSPLWINTSVGHTSLHYSVPHFFFLSSHFVSFLLPTFFSYFLPLPFPPLFISFFFSLLHSLCSPMQ